MKRTVIALAVAALSALPALAGGGSETGKPAGSQIVLRLADNQPDNYPTVVGDLEFARLVGERSNGRIKIDVYNNGQLGDEKSVIEQVQFGGIDFTRVSISPLASFNPALNGLQMPYLYRNADHLWKVLNGPIGDEMLKSMEAKGFVGLVYYDAGARNFYNTKKPIYTVADMKGMKIRVQESALMMGLVSALGAVPTPMPYGDVYSALKTNVIDGAENNWPSYDTAGHYEVAKYYSIDEHTRVPEMVIASKTSMDKLSKEDQELIRKAAKDSQAVQIKSWSDYEKKSEAKVVAAGCKINKIKDQAEFAAAMQSLYNDQTAEIKALIERVKAVQ